MSLRRIARREFDRSMTRRREDGRMPQMPRNAPSWKERADGASMKHLAGPRPMSKTRQKAWRKWGIGTRRSREGSGFKRCPKVRVSKNARMELAAECDCCDSCNKGVAGGPKVASELCGGDLRSTRYAIWRTALNAPPVQCDRG